MPLLHLMTGFLPALLLALPAMAFLALPAFAGGPEPIAKRYCLQLLTLEKKLGIR